MARPPATIKVHPQVIGEDVLDSLLEGCQLISYDWRYLYVNKALVAQSHKSKNQLIGHTMMEAYPGIDKTEMFTHLRQVMKDRQPYTMENDFNFPDGSQGWFELRMEPVEQGVLIFSIDITERKKAELHLKELNELKTKFIDIAAHQMRTPVSIIRWTIEIMQGQNANKDPEIVAKGLQTIYKANNDIRVRISDLLTALNIEESRVTLDKKNVQLEDVATSVVKKLQADAHEKDITLSLVKPDSNLPPILADRECMEDIVTKLIHNAIIYTNSKGKVTVKLYINKESVRFEVADNGVGIPETDKKSVFERFFRGANASTMQPNGYGLGLYIVKYFVSSHNGTIGFSSTENKGSVFWFELPPASP